MSGEKKSFAEIDELTSPEERARMQRVVDEIGKAAHSVQAPSDLLARGMEKVRQLPPPRRPFSLADWSPWTLSLVPTMAVVLVIVSLMPLIHQQMHKHPQKPAPRGALRVTIRSSDTVTRGTTLVCGNSKRRKGSVVRLISDDGERIITAKVLTSEESNGCSGGNFLVLHPEDFRRLTAQVEVLASASYESDTINTNLKTSALLERDGKFALTQK